MNTSAELLACKVHIEPEAPEFMALSIGTTSSPSTSPTMTRRAFMRIAQRTRSAQVMRPTSSTLASPRLKCDHLVVALGKAVEGQLVVRFDRHQAFSDGWNVGGKSPQQGGLAVTHAAADQEVGARPYRCAEERPDHRRKGRPLHELVQGDVQQAVQAQEQMRLLADPADGEQPRSIGELQVDPGVSGVEQPLREPDPTTEVANEVDEFIVAVGHGGAANRAAVRQIEPDGLGTGGVDIDHVVAVQMVL